MKASPDTTSLAGRVILLPTAASHYDLRRASLVARLRGEEVTVRVIDGPQEPLHAQKTLL